MGVGAFVVLLPAALFLVRDAPTPAATEADLREEDDDTLALDGRAALQTRSFWILAFALFTFFFYFMALLEHLVLFLTAMSQRDLAPWARRFLLIGATALGAVGVVILTTFPIRI